MGADDATFGSAELSDRVRPGSIADSERIDELANVTRRHGRAIRQTVRCRPAIAWQVKGPEQPIQERQVDRKVLVDRFPLGPVMPVMELRRGQDPAQRPEPEADVRVDERRLNAHERHIGEERRLGEPEQLDRHVGQAASDRDVHQMQTRSGQPVHDVGRMMNAMKAPEDGHPVKRAVHPVLHEVGEKQDGDELDDERPATTPRAECPPRRPTRTASSPASSSAAS